MPKIKGGYYLKAKCVQESWIAKAPPHVREIWDLFLRKAFYKDKDKLKRGQLIITYSEIIEELAWFVGYRKMTYKKHHCEIAMKALVKHTMVTTAKTTRGVIVTILNYSRYQDIKNYERYTKQTTDTTGTLQPTATIEKEVKEVKEVKITPPKRPVKKRYGEFQNVLLTVGEFEKLADKFNGTAGAKIENLSFAIEQKGYKYKSHYLTILKWASDEEKKNGIGAIPNPSPSGTCYLCEFITRCPGKTIRSPACERYKGGPAV